MFAAPPGTTAPIRSMCSCSAPPSGSIAGVMCLHPCGMRLGGTSTAFPSRRVSVPARSANLGLSNTRRTAPDRPTRLKRSNICTIDNECPPKLKKVVVPAYPLQLEQLLPDPRQDLLHLPSRRLVLTL